MASESLLVSVSILCVQDSTGRVSFIELMTALSIMSRGTVAEKLKLCFRLYEVDELRVRV